MQVLFVWRRARVCPSYCAILSTAGCAWLPFGFLHVCISVAASVLPLVRKHSARLGCFLWLCHLQQCPSVRAVLSNEAQAWNKLLWHGLNSCVYANDPQWNYKVRFLSSELSQCVFSFFTRVSVHLLRLISIPYKEFFFFYLNVRGFHCISHKLW